MATCLVTGGAGFLGSHLCDELLRRGHRVICVDNLETGSLTNIEHIRVPEFVHLNTDIIAPYFVDEPVDFVYHLASPASPIDYLRLPLHTLKVGSHGTHHTLGLAKKHRARFLIASTSEVYGDPQVHPQTEDYWGHVNPIGPRGVYDEAKRYAEALTMAYHRQQGVDTAIIRIFNTYGPRMRPHDGRAIPTFMRQALTDRPITVFGTGSQTRSFCYVDDLIRGMIALAESGEHMPVNVGNPDEFTLLELAEAVLDVTGSSSEIVHEALPVDDPQVRRPDITRAKELLGWEPEVSLRDGLQRTLDGSGRDALIGAGV
jgi:dTDP-glucose 4,6-dehydratase